MLTRHFFQDAEKSEHLSLHGPGSWTRWVAGSLGCMLLAGCGTPSRHTALSHPVRTTRASVQTARPVITRYPFHLTRPVWTAAWQQQAARALPALQAAVRVAPYSETTLNGVTWWVYPLPWHQRWWFAVSNAQGYGVWIGRRWNQTPAAAWPPLIQQAWHAAHIWQKTHHLPAAAYQSEPAAPQTPAQWHAVWRAAGTSSPAVFDLGAGNGSQQWNENWSWPLPKAASVSGTQPRRTVTLRLMQPGSTVPSKSITWNVDVGLMQIPGTPPSWFVFRHLLTQSWELPLSVLLPSRSASTP